ncbi:hypothetical protein [Flammeovirga sp. EKP202]|uniref:hypothetical protein n=1 Tax=Flammeovirga sp. EKP202 TaxID=2770592 RepID=UPI00165FE647|nr:hypothetical protein [Flammeovirga sp. EKP202]MBD0405130.1 hypothetical protein [Flammeovirga sp. EKP202]
MNNEQQILQDIYQSIKDKNILLLNTTLNVKGEDIPFWFKRFGVILEELKGISGIDPTAQKVENEQFWLEVMRAFIDVVPR